ncbi:MAG: EthD family reductase [Alphaproteobacteria bacterium]
MGLLKRKPEFTSEQFREHWLEIHGPLGQNVPGVRRYVQHHVVGDARHPDLPPADQSYDGIVEMWFDDEEAMKTALATPEAKAMFADGALFIESVTSYIVESEVLVHE